MVMVMAVGIGEDALPSTSRIRYHLLESSTWRSPSWRSQAQPNLGAMMLHLGAMMLHHHHPSCLR